MEAAEVGLYLFLTCVFASLLRYPASPIRRFINNTIELRALMGLAVGATVVAIVISPWGKQSGGHFNPALTLAFYRLNKMWLLDAVLYIAAQFAGAIAGVCVARYMLPETFGRRAIRYAVTAPGARGSAVAFFGELAISFVLMSTILLASNRETTGALHTILRWSPVRDLHHHGSATFRNEHESCQKLRTRIARELLARDLAVLHRANSGDARGC